jgi:hypothetical protein
VTPTPLPTGVPYDDVLYMPRAGVSGFSHWTIYREVFEWNDVGGKEPIYTEQLERGWRFRGWGRRARAPRPPEIVASGLTPGAIGTEVDLP